MFKYYLCQHSGAGNGDVALNRSFCCDCETKTTSPIANDNPSIFALVMNRFA